MIAFNFDLLESHSDASMVALAGDDATILDVAEKRILDAEQGIIAAQHQHELETKQWDSGVAVFTCAGEAAEAIYSYATMIPQACIIHAGAT